MKHFIRNLLFGLGLLSTLNAQLSTCFAQGTAFTYQGRLNDGGVPASGIYDLRFAIYAASSGGSALSGPITNAASAVSNGLFTVTLDFGAAVFTGANRWLEIGVRNNGDGIFTALAPRQIITSTPYAMRASVSTSLEGALTSANLGGTYGNALALTNAANLLAGSFTGDGGNLTNISTSSLLADVPSVVASRAASVAITTKATSGRCPAPCCDISRTGMSGGTSSRSASGRWRSSRWRRTWACCASCRCCSNTSAARGSQSSTQHPRPLHRHTGTPDCGGLDMKRWFLLLWLLLPLPLIVWHYGPGQRWLARDRSHALIQRAQQAEAQKNWADAESLYQQAAGHIGNSDPRVKTQLDLALVRARYRQGSAVEALNGIDRILADPTFHSQPGPLQREARELAGRIHYHAAWVMRLEGAQRDLWMEEAELGRQNFRLLTESSLVAAQTNYAHLQQTNLEAAVRLQRMSLIELMGRPLPEEGRGMAGQGLTEQMAKRRGQRGNRPGIGEMQDGPPAAGAGTGRFPGGPGS